MFWHNLKYELLINFRTREVLIWMMLFPILMGIMYKVTLGNLYNGNQLETVPVAVVEHETDDLLYLMIGYLGETESRRKEEDRTLRNWFTRTISEKKEEDATEKKLLHGIYCEEEDAYELLRNGEVKGIIFVDPAADAKAPESKADLESIADALSLKDMMSKETVLSLKIKGNGMDQTMLKQFIENHMAQMSVVREMVESGNTDVGSALDAAVTEERNLTEGNTDPLASYMFNLIAMVALFGITVALHIALYSEANLSDFGARRSCSATPKFTAIMAGLCGCCISQIFCVALCITFQVAVLKTDFGNRLGLVYLVGFLGAVMGVAMGFFIGAIGRVKYETKIGISMAIVMGLSFLSGLMVSGIKAMLEVNAPVINDINPVAVVADAFYYLSLDADLGRFWWKVLTMILYTVVFVLLGFLMTRRRKYASL